MKDLIFFVLVIALIAYGSWQRDRSSRPLGELWQVA
jgi:hypothetical protein